MNHRIFLIALLLAFASAPANAQTLTACDWEVGHPSDPDHVGPGRGSGEVDTARAIAACRAAVTAHPDVARFHYQLGRALVYDADRNGGDAQVGMPHLLQAAELGSAQAMFVYGLMNQRIGDACAAEPWTRKAAEAGLKSARISYVNHVLADTWAACPPQVNTDTLESWLAAAREQVSGYYENMLLDALARELGSHTD